MTSFFITILFCITATIQLWPSDAQADPVAPSFTYQGRLFNAAGTAPMTGTVDLRLGILSASGTCLLYEELHTGINLNDSAGVFSVEVGSTVGSSKRTANDPGLQMANLFSNPGAQILAATANCPGGYTPASSDYRLLSVTVIQGGSPTVLSPHQKILSQPTALVAETLQGIGPSGFIRAQTTVTQVNLTTLTDGSDATTLHHHDGRYVQLGSTSAQNLGSGNVLTTGQLGVGAGAPAAGVDIHVQRASPTLRLESTASGGGTGGVEFYSGSTQRARIASPEGSSELQFSTGGSNALIINDQQDASFLGDITTAGNITASGFVNLGNYTNAQEAALITPYLDTDCGVSCLGTMWMNTDLNQLRYWDGISAKTLANFSGTQTAGGAVYSDGTSMRSTAAGTSGQVLTSAGAGAPVWSAVNDTSKLPLAGGTMTGAINMDGQNINMTSGNIQNADQITANRLNINADGQVLLGPRSQFLMGNFTNTEETTYIGTLAAADAGKVWYNSSTDVLKYWDGAGVQSLGLSGAGLTSLNGLTDSVQTFATPGSSGTAPAWTSATGVHTLNIPMAATTGVTAGLISKTEFDAFNAKQDGDPQLADIAGLTPADGAFIVGDGTNFIAESGATVRTSLGLGTMATETAANYVLRDGSTPLTANWDAGGFNISNFTAEMLNGTVAAPALRFPGASTNTGIFSPADDVVAFSANGTETLRITSTGSVGINTTSTGAKLHVNGNIRADGGFLASGSSVQAYHPSLTTTPVDGFFAWNTTAATSTVPERISPRLRFQSKAWDTGTLASKDLFGSIDVLPTSANPATSIMRFGMDPGSGTYSYPLNISSGGNVGIGTANPAAQLEVAGQIKIAEGTEGCAAAGDAGRIRYNASNQLQYCNGSAWQTLGVAGSGLTNFNGQTGSTQSLAVGATGTAPAFVSATDTHTLNIPLASGTGVTSGTISKTDFDAFTAKQDGNARLTDIAGLTPADGNFIVGNGTNFIAESGATARTSLGLGTAAATDSSIYVLRDGSQALTANWNAGGFNINNFTAEILSGTVSSPALRFSGASNNTGIYSPGTDEFAVAIDGVQRMHMTNNSTNFSAQGSLPTVRINNDRSAVGVDPIIKLERMRTDATAPTANFGGRIEMSIEGFSNNSKVDTSDITWAWEQNQTNDTTFRNSYLAFSTMREATKNEVVRISSQGHVGIGTAAPSERLHVVGNVQADGFITSSDRRLKRNIANLDGAEVLRQLRPVSYERTEAPGRTEFGLIAQEVEEHLPNLVITDRTTGLKAVRYQELIALLIRSAQENFDYCEKIENNSVETKNEVENLKMQMAALQAENTELRTEVTDLKAQFKDLESKLQLLLQQR